MEYGGKEMFLVIKCALNFIRENSELIWMIITVIAGSVWFSKYLKQKRAEAFFGFHARLYLRLRTLKEKLNEKDRLNIEDSAKGNIYSLIYSNDYVRKACPQYNRITDEEIKIYQAATSEIKEILLKTENNVYPKWAKRKEWYNSQSVLFDFCEFLENKEKFGRCNTDVTEGEKEVKHITKCKLLVEAIDYILNSIDREKY